MEAIEIKDVQIVETISSCSNCFVKRGFFQGKQVAVKTLKSDDSNMRDSLVQEVLIWSSINNHPNVAPLRGFSTALYDPGASYMEFCIISDYIPRGSLLSYLQRQTKLEVKDVLKIARSAAKGLEYVHSKGIIHRDVKLDNFLLGDDLNVMIMDFGFSERVSEPRGGIIYTKRYAAPEVFHGKYGMPSDVYSFGVCLDMIYHFMAKLGQKSQFPEEMRQLRDWCMEKQMNKRPSMSRVVQVLENMDLSSSSDSRKKKMIDIVPHHAYYHGLMHRLSHLELPIRFPVLAW